MEPQIMLRKLAVALSNRRWLIMGLGRKTKVEVRMEKYQSLLL